MERKMLNDREREHLVAELLEAKRELDRLTLDEDMTELPAPPASERDIAAFEKRCGFPLEPSYRAFLKQHDGWTDFDGDAAILGTKRDKEEWFEDALEMVWDVFDEFGDENPAEDGVAVVLGEDTNNYLFMWPPAEGGMTQIREYEDGKLQRSYASFDEYLVAFLASLKESIQIERDGAEPADDDE